LSASGLLVYAEEGEDIVDMNCGGDDCNTQLNIPATMIPFEAGQLILSYLEQGLNVSIFLTPSVCILTSKMILVFSNIQNDKQLGFLF
jgi:hypothetical protein